MISIVRRGDRGHVGVADIQRGRPGGHRRTGGGVAGGRARRAGGPRQRTAAARRRTRQATGTHRFPAPGVEVFGGVADALTRGFRRRRPAVRIRTSHRRDDVPGHLERTAPALHPADRARWRSTPNATAPARGRGSARPTSSMCQPIRCSTSCRRGSGWAQRTVELPAGRYETILPPSTVADLMIYLSWSMDGRGAQEGRTALSAPGGGTRVGEKLTDLPLTHVLRSRSPRVWSACRSSRRASSSEQVSVFDNGMDIDRVDWIRDGTINALAYPRAAAAEFGVPVAVPADNLLMTGGTDSLADMVAATERGLLLTTLWYIRVVDPDRAAADRADPRRRLPRRGRARSPRRSTTSGSTRARWTCCGGPPRPASAEVDAAARVGRLGDPGGDAVAADPGLPHVVGQPGAIMRRCTIR